MNNSKNTANLPTHIHTYICMYLVDFGNKHLWVVWGEAEFKQHQVVFAIFVFSKLI